ncbi:hypothetical protein SAMN02983003_1956 [Devosia enhydra]|uniref:Carbon monoxide dehydrogenase subunit G n=1 Tax=Devosia enhydra TaxID=665118 RepID=A0A1K2HXI2_9HYPH|nr:carbon monoxide dehydrogenase subunit G [Devosia enhydra]SFZ84344.1 hypothetical protein SAMN02983003_1956 [Devosia enhydra]
MQFGGHYLLGAPRAAVWSALNDAEVLRRTIPGCKSIAWTGPDALALDIQVNLGLLKPVFSGDLTLSNVEPAVSYRLSGRGRGGLMGLAEGAADIVLTDAEGGTRLDFTATGGASGQIMKLGRGLIGHSAQKVIDGFFQRFAEAMGTSLVVAAPAETGTSDPA